MAFTQQPVKHGSADFSDALDLAVSGLNDEDMLLMDGGSGPNELTIDHIHALSTSRQPPTRTASYGELGQGGGGIYTSAGPSPAATHVGDFIHVQRAASSTSSVEAPAARRQRTGSPDEEADSGLVSPLPRVASRKPTPSQPSASGASSLARSNSRPTSTGSAPLTSTASSRGKLPRVAMLAKPALPKREEGPLSPLRSSSSRASPAPSPVGRRSSSAGPSPVKSTASSSGYGGGGGGMVARTASATQRTSSTEAKVVSRSSSMSASRIPRPAGSTSPRPGDLPLAPRAADSPPQKRPDSPDKRPASPQKGSVSPQRSFGSPKKTTASTQYSPAGLARPGLHSTSGAASPAGQGYATAAVARRLGGGTSGRQPTSPSKMDTRRQLEDIMKDLQDIKKDLGLPIDQPASGAAAAGAAAVAAGAAAAEAAAAEAAKAGAREAAGAEAGAAEAAAAEAARAAAAESSSSSVMVQVQETAPSGEAEPALGHTEDEVSDEPAGKAQGPDTSMVDVNGVASEAASESPAADEAGTAASGAVETQTAPDFEEAAPAPADEVLPTSTAAAYVDAPAPVKPLETEVPADPEPDEVPAKQCCACSIM